MPFQSILDIDSGARAAPPPPAQSLSALHDLNLDQLIEELTVRRQKRELAPVFHGPLRNAEAVQYRHEALRDLEQEELLAGTRTFVERMSVWRDYLARSQNASYGHQRERLFLAAAQVYCQAVGTLAGQLSEVGVRSRAFSGLRDYLGAHVRGSAFATLSDEIERVVEGLARIRYTVHVKGGRVTVGAYDNEADYSAEIASVFAKFRWVGASQVRVEVPNPAHMNHVEAQIIDRVELLHEDAFGALHRFCERHADHLDPVIGRFEREIQFYLAYLDYIEPLKVAGLKFCYPRVSAHCKEIDVQDGFEIVLAAKRVRERPPAVVNDFRLSGSQRLLVVTGPNNGGKTTFARMVGQLHYLASLGLPVPAARAELLLPDSIFTHFERQEHIATLRGKLDDELHRIHEILQEATSSSLIVMNESFSSTTLSDARFLGAEVIRRIVERDCLAVYVTFVDELASLGDATVSMVAAVAPDDPSVRTFRVVPQPANGLAYAAAIAEKYGLTYESVRRRVAV